MSVCVSDPIVPQELDTHGLQYLACIHSSEVARTSTRKYFLYHTRSYQKRVRYTLDVASFSLPTSNEARVLHHWLS